MGSSGVTRVDNPGVTGAVSDQAAPRYSLRLFIAGMTPRSLRAIENMRRICEKHLAGRYEVEIVDMYQSPDRLGHGQVVVAPTLVKELPLPVRRLIGDLSDEPRVLRGLGLTASGPACPPDPTRRHHG